MWPAPPGIRRHCEAQSAAAIRKGRWRGAAPGEWPRSHNNLTICYYCENLLNRYCGL